MEAFAGMTDKQLHRLTLVLSIVVGALTLGSAFTTWLTLSFRWGATAKAATMRMDALETSYTALAQLVANNTEAINQHLIIDAEQTTALKTALETQTGLLTELRHDMKVLTR